MYFVYAVLKSCHERHQSKSNLRKGNMCPQFISACKEIIFQDGETKILQHKQPTPSGPPDLFILCQLHLEVTTSSCFFWGLYEISQ